MEPKIGSVFLPATLVLYAALGNNRLTSGLPTNRPQPGYAQLGKARTPKHGLVDLPEFKQQGAELFAGQLLVARIVR